VPAEARSTSISIDRVALPMEEPIEAPPVPMDPPWVTAVGLPIGSGNVEVTCKSLVSIRMKRPGARWKHATGEEVLQLRALQLSDRWAAAVQRATRPLAKPVQIVASWASALSRTRTATPRPSRAATERAASSETIGAVSPRLGSTSQYENHTPSHVAGVWI